MGWQFVPVTMNSLLNGEDTVNAMDLRCFGTEKRTWLPELKYRRRDFFLITFGAILLLVSFLLPRFFEIGNFWMPTFLLP
jgi:energy-coupling factor transport system permease protein